MISREPSAAAGEPIRVLHVISSLHVGGAGRLLLRNVALLREYGVESHVAYLTTRNDLEERFRQEGFPPICLGHEAKAHMPRTILRLARLAKTLRVDVIHTNLTLDGAYGRLAARLSGIPVVATLHDADKPPAFKSNGSLASIDHRTLIEDLLARWLTRRFVAVSIAVRDHYVRNHGVPAGRVDVIYPPLDERALLPDIDAGEVGRLRAELSLESAYPVLLNVARLHPIKDQRLLIESMPHLLERWPDARLLIAGEGEMRPELEELIESRRLGSSVTLLGQRDDVPTLLAASDVFLLSSLSEGLPGSVLEAMGASKPVIASAVGGIPEVVEHGVSGLLVPSREPRAFAKAVHFLAADRALARTMGLAGSRLVSTKFHPQKAVSSMLGLYLTSAKGGRGLKQNGGPGPEQDVTPKYMLMRALRVVQGPRVARRFRNQHIRILAYHGFTRSRDGVAGSEFDTHIDDFRRQLQHLKRFYNVVPLPDVVDHLTKGTPLPPNPVVITIDDAYLSVYTLAYPALREVQLPAAVFPAIDFMDGESFMWPDRVKACVAVSEPGTLVTIPTSNGDVTVDLGEVDNDRRNGARKVVTLLLRMDARSRAAALVRLEDAVGPRLAEARTEGFRPMRWESLSEMVDSGLITVGSHTKSHCLVTTVPDRELEFELTESKRILESRLGICCDTFAYPYGGVEAFDRRTADLVRKAGYRCAVTTVHGMVTKGDDLFMLRRMGVPDDQLKFDFSMSGFGTLLTETKRQVLRSAGFLRAMITAVIPALPE